MSYQSPPPMPPSPEPAPTPPGPKWARTYVAVPAAIALFVVGALIGAAGNNSGGDSDKTSAEPAATKTVTDTRTVTAAPKAAKVEKAEPAPTVTVTKTVKAKPAATSDDAPSGKALFKVWGSAPSGVDITYGSDGTNLQGKGLPMEKTMTVDSDALYYQITAQLQGGGNVHCSITIDGKTKSGQAQGGYNICSAQLNSDFSGGFS